MSEDRLERALQEMKEEDVSAGTLEAARALGFEDEYQLLSAGEVQERCGSPRFGSGVLIADAAQNAMASDYKSITEGLVLILTIVAWDYLLDWLAERFPALRPYLRPSPMLLIDQGCMLKKNLRREMISEDELMGQLREQGVEDVADVKKCYVESDGRISVIRRKPEDDGGKQDDKRAV